MHFFNSAKVSTVKITGWLMFVVVVFFSDSYAQGHAMGIIKVQRQDNNSIVTVQLNYLSGAEAATIISIAGSTEGAFGTLNTMTIMVADQEKANDVLRIIERIDMPEAYFAYSEAPREDPAGFFFRGLREFLRLDGSSSPDYTEVVKDLEHALNMLSKNDELWEYANRLLTKIKEEREQVLR